MGVVLRPASPKRPVLWPLIQCDVRGVFYRDCGRFVLPTVRCGLWGKFQVVLLSNFVLARKIGEQTRVYRPALCFL